MGVPQITWARRFCRALLLVRRRKNSAPCIDEWEGVDLGIMSSDDSVGLRHGDGVADAAEGVVAAVAAAGGDDEVVVAAGIGSRKTILAVT